jgi:hemerythrin
MSLLVWQHEYTVGVPSVDKEHRELIELINRCYRRLGQHTDRASIDAFLDEIQARIGAHFAHEERAMREADYQEYEAHKADHEALLGQLCELKSRYKVDPQAGRAVLQFRLSSWFGIHFSTFDARLHRQLGPQQI